MHRNYRHIEFILANVPVRCNEISKLYVYYSYLLCNLFFSFLNGEQMIDKGFGEIFFLNVWHGSTTMINGTHDKDIGLI